MITVRIEGTLMINDVDYDGHYEIDFKDWTDTHPCVYFKPSDSEQFPAGRDEYDLGFSHLAGTHDEFDWLMAQIKANQDE